MRFSCSFLDSFLFVPWLFEKSGDSCIISIGGSTFLLVVLLYVVDLTCFSHTTKWRWCECTAVYYTSVLAKLREHIAKKRPLLHRTAWRLHHDNARPHVTNHVMQFLAKFNITCVPHPPYSPDLAPCDFLFSSLNTKLRGIRFETSKAVLKKSEEILKDLTKNGLHHVFQEWQQSCKKCIQLGGGGSTLKKIM